MKGRVSSIDDVIGTSFNKTRLHECFYCNVGLKRVSYCKQDIGTAHPLIRYNVNEMGS